MTTVEVHTMRRIIFTLAAGAVLAACGAAGGTGTTSAPSTSGPAAAGSTVSTVSTGTTSLGTVLTNAQGFTLYYFLPERNSKIGACTGGCLTAWPPLVVTGSPTSTSAVTGTLATVSIMANGAAENEVTYNGWPLHTFASDTQPGQTNGEGVGGNWFAVTPGTASTSTGASSASSTPTPAAGTPTASSGGGYGY
jgi:predicted lipoprotein with Yx(FWY)xxD motif